MGLKKYLILQVRFEKKLTLGGRVVGNIDRGEGKILYLQKNVEPIITSNVASSKKKTWQAKSDRGNFQQQVCHGHEKVPQKKNTKGTF